MPVIHPIITAHNKTLECCDVLVVGHSINDISRATSVDSIVLQARVRADFSPFGYRLQETRVCSAIRVDRSAVIF